MQDQQNSSVFWSGNLLSWKTVKAWRKSTKRFPKNCQVRSFGGRLNTPGFVHWVREYTCIHLQDTLGAFWNNQHRYNMIILTTPLWCGWYCGRFDLISKTQTQTFCACIHPHLPAYAQNRKQELLSEMMVYQGTKDQIWATWNTMSHKTNPLFIYNREVNLSNLWPGFKRIDF